MRYFTEWTSEGEQKGGASATPFPGDEDFGKSISEKGFDKGFSDDFPMDFAEMEKNGRDPEADIPF